MLAIFVICEQLPLGRQEIPLSDEEVAAVDEGVAAMRTLLTQLVDVPPPPPAKPLANCWMKLLAIKAVSQLLFGFRNTNN